MSESVFDRLKEALADRYTVQRELGAGGMATVYLAEDLKHHRKVALKVLRPELAATLGPERFLREIEIAAKLTHPHILSVHDSGEAGGFLYYVMPHLEGGSLRDRLRAEKRLPVEDALEITREIGDALSYAHSLGFIHRDIKPENILFEAGHAVVADFGIARAVSDVNAERLTETGLALGTPAYMSPEQGVGEQDVDGRSDIYSLACILYEMLGGDPPYTGSTPQAIIARKLTDPVPSLAAVRETVTGGVEAVLIQALAKIPSDRFATASQFLTALESTTRVPSSVKRKRRLSIPGWVGVSATLLAIGSAIFLLGSWSSVPFNERDWIVIADLENLTGDPVFDQSLDAALAIALQQSRYVNVFPATRVQRTLGRMRRDNVGALTEDLAREVAVRENATVVVIPSISQLDSVYSLAMRVVDPATGNNLVSRSDRVSSKAEVLSALDALGRRLRRDLGESMLAVARRGRPLPQVTTGSLDALKAWANGREDGLTLDQRRDLWLRAVELDSNFAMAHSSLGYYSTWWQNDRVRGDEHFAKALSLADRVTERERMLIQGNVASWQGNRAGAVDAYEIYLAQYPDDASTWYSLGYALMLLERNSEALTAFKQVLTLDPARTGAYTNIATIHVNAGRRLEAVSNYLRAFELSPDLRLVENLNHEFGFNYVILGELGLAEEAFTEMLSGTQTQRAQGHRSLGLLRMYEGRYADAIAHVRQATALHNGLSSPVSELRDRFFLATAFQTKGDAGALEQQLTAAQELLLLEQITPDWLQHWVRFYARSGRLAQARELADTVAARTNPDNEYDVAANRRAQGEIALADGRVAEAATIFEQAFALSEDEQNLEPLAACAIAAGDLELALQRYERFLAFEPLGYELQEAWILAHYLIGRIHEELGDTAHAVERYSQFLNIWKDGDDGLESLVDARSRMMDLTGLEH